MMEVYNQMQERIDTYWSKRAGEFSDCRLKDLESPQRQIWEEIITEALPEIKPLRALDVGTGAGFYAFLLNDLGAEVTGIDYSQSMIDYCLKNAKDLGYDDIQFMTMDAQHLEFEDHSFDFIISRNVTWTLPDPEKAYAEWCRVLAPGGVILNFDANYGQAFKKADEKGDTSDESDYYKNTPYKYPAMSPEMIRERNDIAKALYICDFTRPQWDVDVLVRNGIDTINIDMNIAKRLFENDADYQKIYRKYMKNTDTSIARLFMIQAQK